MTENTDSDRQFARDLFGAQEPNWISDLFAGKGKTAATAHQPSDDGTSDI